MKKKYILIILTCITIILSNIPPVHYLFDYTLDEKHYRYRNASGNFDVADRSGNNIIGIKESFKAYVKSNKVKEEDAILYRTFWKNPIAFWRWHSYFNTKDERYKLPYKN
ncbi:hypothetical protein ACFE6N_18785 [Pedobacter sp. BG31]|uniref:hypothetical protein n=1 Tax=Pedobacter sp. BG31 TaxID=3349697 RepID=UPI0035F2D25E